MPIRAWFIAFVFGQLVEIPIYMWGLSVSLPIAFGASAITHPLMWFGIFGPHWHAGYLSKAVTGELFAWLGEAAYFALLFGKRRAWLWSLIANAASLGTSLLSRHYFGVP